jgi:putative NADH-flavin reductase
MNLALIGATGNVGTRLISELRRRGHQVTAIARHPEKLDRQDGVNPAVADVQNENALAAVLAGHDVAIHSVKLSAAAKKGTSLAVDKEPGVGLRSGLRWAQK